eukprot:4572571-Pyramimonas_sp.AAC.1
MARPSAAPPPVFLAGALERLCLAQRLRGRRGARCPSPPGPLWSGARAWEPSDQPSQPPRAARIQRLPRGLQKPADPGAEEVALLSPAQRAEGRRHLLAALAFLIAPASDQLPAVE